MKLCSFGIHKYGKWIDYKVVITRHSLTGNVSQEVERQKKVCERCNRSTHK